MTEARTEREIKLERLCRYIARPAVSEKRLSLTRGGHVRYQLKTPYKESLPRERSECCGHGTTHVIFEPLDFMYRMYGMPRAQGCAGAAIARLAALVPKPRVNLTRFHGVFAPNSKQRALVTPAKRGKGNKAKAVDEPQTSIERRAAMTWAQRLKRVFNIDIKTCSECGGAVKVIACIEDPAVMPKALAVLAGQALKKILDHLTNKAETTKPNPLPESRAPPAGIQAGLFG